MDSILNIPVHLYDKLVPVSHGGKLIEYNLRDVLTASDRFIVAPQEQVRQAIAQGMDVKEIRRLKQQCIATTISATFPGARRASEPHRYNEMISIDVDAKDNPAVMANWPALRDELAKIPAVAYAGRSISYQGFFCVIRLTPDPAAFSNHFNALRQDFASGGLTIDSSCSDITRLRFLSYDPDCYINDSAERYTKLAATTKPPARPGEQRPGEQRPQSSAATASASRPASYASATSIRDRVERLVSAIEQQRIDIAPTYRQWFSVAVALYNTYGEAGRSTFHRISQYYPRYDYAEADRQYTKVAKAGMNKITINTLFHIAGERGVLIN